MPRWSSIFRIVEGRRMAAMMRNDPSEKDRFIFYRGVGRFSTPFTVRSIAGESLEVRNASAETIPAAFLLRVGTLSPEKGS